MRAVYPIVSVCLLTLILIEKENSILSRISNNVLSGSPFPQPDTFTSTQGENVTLKKMLIFPKPSLTLNYSSVSTPDVRSGAPRHVLIMAVTRTGSSFVGEFFNEYEKDLFYLYEPLWHISSMFPKGPSLDLYQDALQGLFKCNFSALEKFIKPPPKDHVTTVFFRRVSSNSLCGKSVCSPVVQGITQRFPCSRRRCGPLNLTLASEFCKSCMNRVIKTVRIQQLDTVKALMEDPQINMKIIHLVRDPRAVLSSRMVAFSYRYHGIKGWTGEVNEDKGELKSLKENCDNIKATVEVVQSRPPWLQDNYMLVRYEDITRDPLGKAQEMYKFIGIPFSSRVQKWILANTQSHHGGVYSTRRNSSEQTNRWRVNIPFPVVQAAQKVCGPTMKLLGYKTVDDENTLLNTSISLLEERRRDWKRFG